MKNANFRHTLCLLAALGFVFPYADTAQAQLLPQLFGTQRKQPPEPKVSPELVRALRPSESDMQAAKNVRDSLIDTERNDQNVDQRVKPIEYTFAMTESPEPDDVTPQVVVETRFIECPSRAIAPKGMLAEQGWVLLPVAYKQKSPAALRVKDLTDGENANLAAGVLNVTEQFTPTLIRFIDTEEFLSAMTHCQGDSRCHVLQAPKLTLLSGQQGKIRDTTDIAYGWTNSRDDAVVEVMTAGTIVDVQPEVLEDGSVCMKEFQATFTQMIGEDKYPLDPDNEIVLSLPRLYTRKFNLPATIPAGKTLLVALPQSPTLQEEPRQKTRSIKLDTLCLAVTCHVITSETVAESPQNTEPDESTAAQTAMTESEFKRQVDKEWERFWMNDKPSPLTQDRLTHLTGGSM